MSAQGPDERGVHGGDPVIATPTTGGHGHDRGEAGRPEGAGPAPAEAPTVTREVDLPADVADVWEALTSPPLIGAWFGATVEWALEPGAPMRVGRGDDGAAPRQGVIDEVEPAHRLRYRWWPSDGAGATTAVTYELEPRPGGTRLVITELPVPATARAALSAGGGVRWDLRVVGLWLGLHARPRCRA